MDPALFMPLEAFKEAYFEFRKQSGYDKVKWNKEHYDTVFQDASIHIITGTRDYNGEGSKTTQYLTGIDLKQQDVDLALS